MSERQLGQYQSSWECVKSLYSKRESGVHFRCVHEWKILLASFVVIMTSKFAYRTRIFYTLWHSAQLFLHRRLNVTKEAQKGWKELNPIRGYNLWLEKVSTILAPKTLCFHARGPKSTFVVIGQTVNVKTICFGVRQPSFSSRSTRLSKQRPRKTAKTRYEDYLLWAIIC